MSGLVIHFPKKRASAYCSAKTNKSRRHGRRQRPPLRAQIERITKLLEELDGISDGLGALPPAMLARMCASMGNVEKMLGPRDVGHSTLPTRVEDEGDPQPHVDREALERLYHFLDSYQ